MGSVDRRSSPSDNQGAVFLAESIVIAFPKRWNDAMSPWLRECRDIEVAFKCPV